MKKVLILTALSVVLAGCSAISSDQVEKRDDLKHVCIKDNKDSDIKDFAVYLANSLKHKGITSDIYQGNALTNCHYAMSYSLRAKRGHVLRAKLRLSEILVDNKRKNIGEVSYKLRGKEKEKLAVSGVQGQTDFMINELFKNY